MINSDRLKALLVRIIEISIPHESECNLETKYGSYCVGCTCRNGEKASKLKAEIDQLEEEPSEEIREIK